MNLNQRNRRRFFKKAGLLIASLPFSFSAIAAVFSANRKGVVTPSGNGFNFSTLNDRIWIGEKFWSIPMEDWRVRQGKLEFTGTGRFSRVNLLTTVIGEGRGEVEITADLGVMSNNKNGGSAGFSIGITDEADPDVKAACYYGKGLNAGVDTGGHLFIADQTKPLPEGFDYSDMHLSVKAERRNRKTQLTVSCGDKSGQSAGLIYETAKDISGLVALVNNFKEKNGSPFWFNNFSVGGTKTTAKPENSFGPILWAMHTLSKDTLKIVAQMPPLGEKDHQTVDLLLKKGNRWKKVQTQSIDPAACTAHFQLDGWDAGADVPYRLVYNNNGNEHHYDGTIRKEPLDRQLKFGGLTCQHGNGYPYSPVVKNLTKHDPDLLYFSGDQLYEGNGGYPIKRQPEPDAILSYLGKWYMFGWAFGDVMRDRPTVCTPDDHDVFQGNLWGEGGEAISFDAWSKFGGEHGGFVQTPKMVNVVNKTQCGHMPACFHPEPLNSGITTWYTDLLYGNVSFAVISDRMFKSGPEMIREKVEGKRRDQIRRPLAENELESPDLEFLGDRQMQFLEHWINDWRGANMKVLLSQTLFSNVATHHGPRKEFLYGDMDSGGWPKQRRDDAVRLVRKGLAFHINGDQHLPFIVQYGLDEARDAGWTFCTPAISVGYPRWAQPDLVDAPFTDRPAHGLSNTGVYQDIFDSTNYVYAVGNPEDKPGGKNRYITAHNKASGFGLITFDPDERTIKMEAFRFFADKNNPTENDQFPGWPLTISQMDNDGRKATAYLPTIEINKPGQVVKVISEDTEELVNVFRIKGTVYRPKVYDEGRYTVVVGEGEAVETFRGIKSVKEKSSKTIQVNV